MLWKKTDNLKKPLILFLSTMDAAMKIVRTTLEENDRPDMTRKGKMVYPHNKGCCGPETTYASQRHAGPNM